jgi:hypothetical protein
MTLSVPAPETKAGGAVADAFDQLSRTFEEFKAVNDDRLVEIERRMAPMC